MSKRKLLSFAAFIFLFVSLGVTAYAGVTINMYRHGAPCGKLGGFAGLLQAAHFVPSSNCSAPSKGKCSGSACIKGNPASGTGSNGKCTLDTSTTPNTCVCI